MGTFDSVYKNKIRQLEEENRQLRKILREAEQLYPPTPIIPTPEVSPQDSPDRPWRYPRYTFDPLDPSWTPPMKAPAHIKPQVGPWMFPRWPTRLVTPDEQPPVFNPSPYRYD